MPTETATKPRRNMHTVRLACMNCDRNDHDFIAHVALAAAEAEFWKDISREQTYTQACKTYDDPAYEPPGFSVFHWVDSPWNVP
jgi:hypothetical protein